MFYKINVSNEFEEKVVRIVRNGIEVPMYSNDVLDLGANWKECSFSVRGQQYVADKQCYSKDELLQLGFDNKSIEIRYNDVRFRVDFNQYSGEWETSIR